MLENKIIEKIIWYLNHLKNTKIIYTQKEVADYIQHQIIDYEKNLLEGTAEKIPSKK